MNILWSIHLYPPAHNCGSEYVAHNINKYLAAKGHRCRIILHQAKMHNVRTPYEYEGIEVMGATGHVDAYRWADVVITHLDYTQFTMLMAHEAKRPIVHFVHNSTPYNSIMNAPRDVRNYVVYNSTWIKDELKYPHESMVLTPPCDVNYYNVCDNPEENEYITLINLDQNKGGGILKRVAEAMPDRKFLGVIGGYSSPSHIGQITDQPQNVTIVPNTPNIREVYKKTRILLMPSAYESWGRTATEAMCSGIPVIACPTPGLKENLGDAGIFVAPRESKILHEGSVDEQTVYFDEEYDISGIVNEIKKLDNKKHYSGVSEKCRARANELKPDHQLEQLEQFLLNARF